MQLKPSVPGVRTARRAIRALRSYVSDLYHFLLVASWPSLFALLVVLYLGSNVLFALVYLAGGDLIEGARPGSFSDAFFFSVQTMATLSFGKMAPHTTWANILVAIESLAGLVGIALVTGMVFAKFSRPTARVLFSRVAVVSDWNGTPSLIFRMANRRGNRIVEAQIHVVFIRDERTYEGEPFRRLHDLELIRRQHALFTLSWTAVHPITESSPLFGLSAADLEANDAEIMVSLTGLDESFSQTVHARHAYGARDLVWDARFADIVRRLPDGRRQIDYAHFHEILPTQAARKKEKSGAL